ncbi:MULTISPECIES: PTS sugar transporter subunit IIA [Bacillus]|uniref:BglG family transcription antiterminator n=1 Tax=Bacillus TaxID=1386 RepID=UPI0007FB4F7B|nr:MULTISPECIES: PTS sugar transporter subunit IIA [Bacillus]NWF42608.1 PRD domain-containing protein [Bacillus sp. 8A6]OBW48484.1 transcription antiterminator [Bacillus safensis]RAU57105.1 PRD domain-containing protein [Bacillus safensis]
MMMTADPRTYQLIQRLFETKGFVKLEELTASFRLSDRSIRNLIKEANEYLKEAGAMIKTIRGKGYTLLTSDQDAFLLWLHQQKLPARSLVPVMPEERVRFMMRKLLLQSDYLKIDQLAEELFISRMTVSSDLKKGREMLARYGMTLVSKPGFGLKIEGDELQKRTCYADLLLEEEPALSHITEREQLHFPDISLETIRSIVLTNLHQESLLIKDIALKNLVIHLAIAIQQTRKNQRISASSVRTQRSPVLMRIAQKIIQQVSDTFYVTLSEDETDYLVMHLLANQTWKEAAQHQTTVEVQQAVTVFLQHIEKTSGHRFADDSILQQDLMLHMKPLLNRIQYGVSLQNPLLHEIKMSYPYPFDLAVSGLNALRLVRTPNEDEAAYVALHIAASFERSQLDTSQKKKAIIVCGSGLGTARLLEIKLKAAFQHELDIVELYSYQDYLMSTSLPCDVIITTVPLTSKGKPVIQVSAFFEHHDIQRVNEVIHLLNGHGAPSKELMAFFQERLTFMNTDLSSKDEVLDILCSRLEAHQLVSSSFRSSVFEREQMSSTYLGSGIAMPHPLITNEGTSSVAIAHLKQPIDWQGDQVSLVFLLAIHKDDAACMNQFFEQAVDLLDNPDRIHSLKQAKTFNELMDALFQ